MLGSLASPPKSLHELWPLYPLKIQRFHALANHRRLVDTPVIEALKSLSDYKLAVVTSSAESEIAPILERDGVLPLLGTAVYAGDVARLKPDPEPYRVAMQRLGARRALAFEDSAAGLASARAAGCDVVQVAHPRDLPRLIARHLLR